MQEQETSWLSSTLEKRSNVMVLDRFPFSRLDVCFFDAKKKNGDSQVQVTCGESDWPVGDNWYFSKIIGWIIEFMKQS